LSPEILSNLQTWVGRSQTLTDQITMAPMRGLSATLDRNDPEPKLGDALPPLWHWLYFLPHTQQSELGLDGHAAKGGFLPPVPLPRRMWAGSRFEWHSPICVGDTIARTSSVQSVQHKVGKSGDLVFVKVLHELRNGAQLCLSEEHDIVYKSAPLANEVAAQPVLASKGLEPGLALWQREVVPDDVLLFRYSALTFNGHRIHYDRSYVTQQEGYPGLVVHGPLIATLLVDVLRRNTNRTLKKFEFKAIRPSFECADGRSIKLMAQTKDNLHVNLWAQDHEAYLTMQATAELN